MQPKIKIGMVQINNGFFNQSYFPYSVGILQAFSQRHLKEPDNFEFLSPIYSRTLIRTAVEDLLAADIVCFSVYVWNIKISLKIAGEIKKNKPQTLIIFGGPQIPNQESEVFLRLNPFIDMACHDEGENIFLNILENYNSHNWAKIPSISYINDAGKFIRNPICARTSDLNEIPSPYLEGIFNPLIETNPQSKWVALWETNRGCPFSCAYCDWGSATKNKVYAHDTEILCREVDWFSKNKIEFIFCCNANFGILERDLEIVKYVAENKRKYGYPKALSVQSTKNFTEDAYEIYKVMSDAGLNKGVSLSLQSLNEDTLRDIRRKNIPNKIFRDVQERLTSLKIETFTDLILGLPNETYETFVNGVSTIIENGQHNRIQFNNLSILPNSEMGDSEYQKKFGFDIVETKIINIHGSMTDTGEVDETQRLVVGTNTLPKADWLRTRIFGWMASLLYFDKLLQIPFIILHSFYHISFHELIEIFINNSIKSPILTDVHSFFVKKATDIQNGKEEFCESGKWLNIWWPADELILIKLCTENKLLEFYKEAEQAIGRYLRDREIFDGQSILRESILLNRDLIKLPFQDEDFDISLSYNIWDVYYAILRNVKLPLKKGEFCYKIDRTSIKWQSWEDWCREVIWYGNKKGAYIYNCKPIGSDKQTVKA